jgi:transposase
LSSTTESNSSPAPSNTHFTTLAKFVSQHADEIEELFEQILLVCHEQDLVCVFPIPAFPRTTG